MSSACARKTSGLFGVKPSVTRNLRIRPIIGYLPSRSPTRPRRPAGASCDLLNYYIALSGRSGTRTGRFSSWREPAAEPLHGGSDPLHRRCFVFPERGGDLGDVVASQPQAERVELRRVQHLPGAVEDAARVDPPARRGALVDDRIGERHVEGQLPGPVLGPSELLGVRPHVAHGHVAREPEEPRPERPIPASKPLAQLHEAAEAV